MLVPLRQLRLSGQALIVALAPSSANFGAQFTWPITRPAPLTSRFKWGAPRRWFAAAVCTAAKGLPLRAIPALSVRHTT
jgi:hypothetical protein